MLSERYDRHAEHPFRLDAATLRRNDEPPDYVSFREAAINLLIHQDYGDHGRKASIRFFRDRTVFWNPGDAFATPGELPDPTEKEVRNPAVVAAFRRIGLSEQAGTGIREIFRCWQRLGHVPPVIDSDKARKTFELLLLREELDRHRFAEQRYGRDAGEVGHSSRDQPRSLVTPTATDVGITQRMARGHRRPRPRLVTPPFTGAGLYG